MVKVKDEAFQNNNNGDKNNIRTKEKYRSESETSQWIKRKYEKTEKVAIRVSEKFDKTIVSAWKKAVSMILCNGRPVLPSSLKNDKFIEYLSI